nr:hypothetical protein [Tanacetum cinerariifolium]GEW79792.1 hypothetical protein [Tanacetum cinerariifolium]
MPLTLGADEGIDIGGSPRCQDIIGGTPAQTRSERVLEQPNEPPFSEGHTSGSGEERMEHTFKLTDTIPPTPYNSPLTGVTHLEVMRETSEPLKDDDDATLAETLLNIKRSIAKDKGKGIMQETELPRKFKKREMIQLGLDEELAQKLHDEELAKETGIDWNDPEVLRYHALQNRVFSKAKVRKNMCTYLKNQGGYKQSYFKRMKYEDIRPIFKRVWDQIHTFVPKDSEIEKEVMKRYGFNLQQESSKKQKLDEQTEEEFEAQANTDQEIEVMKLYVKIIPDGDITIDVIPLATKPQVIVKYKIVKEGNISTYHIIRADGSTKRYTSMIKLLENIDREDLETLWKLVKDKHGNTRPGEDYERVLWGDIKVMFEPDIEMLSEKIEENRLSH